MDAIDVKIGLECHAQLLTRSKLFCSCSTSYHNDGPNTHVCPVCLGLPGALPTVNKKAIEYGIKAAIALNCTVQEKVIFYRKNYYYPDLPRGFQISQYDYPLALDGFVYIGDGGEKKKIRIKRVHLEEDPGRLIYRGTISTSTYSLIDYNRSGIPLLEIVTEPDISSPKEARALLVKIRSILEYLGIFDGNLDGSLRVDANISIQGGERIEVKNISSYKGVEKALSFEITRQKNLLRRGEKLERETRHYDETHGVTFSLRKKEEEEDYRYFPEPDLVPIHISQEWIDEIKKEIPEMPDEKLERFIHQYKISRSDAAALTADLDTAEFYENIVSSSDTDPRTAATWVAHVLRGELNYRSMSMREAEKRISVEQMVDILRMLKDGEITEKGAVLIIREMLDSEGKKPREIVKDKGLRRISTGIQNTIKAVIRNNKKAVSDYMSGKKEALNFLVGEVMKESKGRIDPKMAYEMIKEELEA